MPLEWQTVPVAFNQGLDTRTNPKLVVPGKWNQLLNLTLSKDNTPQTRDGHSALISTANGNGLATYNAELLTYAAGGVSSVSTAASLNRSVTGLLGSAFISKSELRRSTGMQDTPDCATGGGFTCYVWREKDQANTVTGVNVILVDETTGTQLIPSTQMRTSAAVFCPRVVYSGGFFFICYIQGTSFFCRLIDTTAPTTLGNEVALVTSASLANINFDATPWFGTSPAIQVAHGWADGAISVKTMVIGVSVGLPAVALGGTNVFTEVQMPVATITGIAVCAFSTNTRSAVFASSTGAAAMSGLAGVTLDVNLTIATAATRLDATVGTTASSCHLGACQAAAGFIRVHRDFVSEWSTNALTNIRAIEVNTTLGTFGSWALQPSASFAAGVVARGPQGPFMAAKPFLSGGRIYQPVYVAEVYNNLSSSSSNPRTANTQNSFFVLDAGATGSLSVSAVPVGKALYGTFGLASINGTAPAVSTPCSVINPSTGVFAQVASELTFLVLSNGNNISPTGLVRLNLSPNATTPVAHKQLGEATFFAGGQLCTYDGAQVVEHGFDLFPEGIGCTAGGAGTGSMTDGVHQVVAVYAWIDNAGQRHISAPSLPVSVTVNSGGANTGSILVNVPTLLLTQKTGVEILVYCTTASGLTFFRANLNNGAWTPVLNSAAATTVNFRVSEADSSLSANEVLYTQPLQSPTALPNLSPPPCNYIWEAHNRLWFNKADKPGWIGYSQEYVNNVGLQFNDVLEDALPAESGGFVAGGQLDEKVIIFGRDRIYAMFGSGPNASGSFNNYTHPQDIQADVGCSDALSVLAEIPQGIIFKSKKGWHILGRDLSVTYIGEGVATFDDLAVTAAVVIPDRKECRFVLSGTANGLTGVTLVFSYLIGQWSYFCKTLGSSYQPLGAAWWPAAGANTGRYVTISLADGLNQDTPGTYVDAPGVQGQVGITTTARTAWLHVSKLEGFQRVRWLYLSGTANVQPNSTLTVAVDFDDTYGNTAPGSYTFTSNLLVDFGNWGSGQPIDVRHKLRRMKCKSVAFTFTESGGSPFISNRMTGIQAMALEVGAKKGVNRLPAAQGIG